MPARRPTVPICRRCPTPSVKRLKSVRLAGVFLLGAVGVAQAAEVVPYTGHLDRDGAPVDGIARLRFRMYTVAGGAAANADDACDGSGLPECIWLEEHSQVPVRNGAFTVKLGRPAPPDAARNIAPLLRRKTPLFLDVSVFDGGNGRFSVLGRQEIHPAPQAIFSLQPDIEVETLTATHAFVERLDVTDASRATTGTIEGALDASVAAGGASFTNDVTLSPGAELSVNGLPFKGLRIGHDADPARGIAAWSGQLTSSQDCLGAGGNCPTSTVLPVVDHGRAFCALTLAGTFEVREAVHWFCAVYRSAEPGNPWRLDERRINNGDNSTQVNCQATCPEW
jgi:hypothetical protein